MVGFDSYMRPYTIAITGSLPTYQWLRGLDSNQQPRGYEPRNLPIDITSPYRPLVQESNLVSLEGDKPLLRVIKLSSSFCLRLWTLTNFSLVKAREPLNKLNIKPVTCRALWNRTRGEPLPDI